MPGIRSIGRTFLLGTLGRMTAREGSLPILAGPLKGLRLPNRTSREYPGMLLGHYETPVVHQIHRIVGPASVCYDVGAHIGIMTLAMAVTGASVFAFEPSSANRDRIQELASANNFDKRITIVPFAVGARNSKQRLIQYQSTAMYLIEDAIDGQDVSSCASESISTTTLDSFVFEQGNPEPHFIKIDVEGAEALVLEGANRTLNASSPVLLMELHGPQNALRTWDLLTGSDYLWHHIAGNRRSPISSGSELQSVFSAEEWTRHFLLLPPSGNTTWQ